MSCKISFIIPAKNEAENIGNCLKAIQRMNFGRHTYEIIVVDNGSTDDTAEIAGQYNALVLYKPEGTIAAVRNFGAQYANGGYLAFIDADVVVSPNWLKNALLTFDHPDIACVGSTPDIPEDSTWVQKTWQLQYEGGPSIIQRTWLATANMVVRSNIFKELGGFNENIATCEDVDFGYRLSKKYQIVENKSISAVHKGEDWDLIHFFKKEIWRGRSNYSGFLSHGIVLNEIPSLLLPIYYLMVLILCFAAIITSSQWVLCIAVLSAILFPYLKTGMIIKRTRKFKYVPALMIIWGLYGFAKALSVLIELETILSTKTFD